MTTVIASKKFDPSLLNISVPVPLPIPAKNTKRYTSFISYGDQSKNLYIQLPSLIIKDKGVDSLTFDNSENLEFLNALEGRCIDEIVNRSGEFFNGKLFSKGKIESSFTRSRSSNEWKVPVNWNTVKIRDQYSLERTACDHFTSAVPLVLFEGIIYKPESMTLQFSIKQMKVFIPPSDLETWVIQDDEEGDEEGNECNRLDDEKGIQEGEDEGDEGEGIPEGEDEGEDSVKESNKLVKSETVKKPRVPRKNSKKNNENELFFNP